VVPQKKHSRRERDPPHHGEPLGAERRFPREEPVAGDIGKHGVPPERGASLRGVGVRQERVGILQRRLGLILGKILGGRKIFFLGAEARPRCGYGEKDSYDNERELHLHSWLQVNN
jgi:hypothetical protein